MRNNKSKNDYIEKEIENCLINSCENYNKEKINVLEVFSCFEQKLISLKLLDPLNKKSYLKLFELVSQKNEISLDSLEKNCSAYLLTLPTNQQNIVNCYKVKTYDTPRDSMAINKMANNYLDIYIKGEISKNDFKNLLNSIEPNKMKMLIYRIPLLHLIYLKLEINTYNNVK